MKIENSYTKLIFLAIFCPTINFRLEFPCLVLNHFFGKNIFSGYSWHTERAWGPPNHNLFYTRALKIFDIVWLLFYCSTMSKIFRLRMYIYSILFYSCQARVLVHLQSQSPRSKLKKRTRADAIIQMHPPPPPRKLSNINIKVISPSHISISNVKT